MRSIISQNFQDTAAARRSKEWSGESETQLNQEPTLLELAMCDGV
jgi:hypothetical protein